MFFWGIDALLAQHTCGHDGAPLSQVDCFMPQCFVYDNYVIDFQPQIPGCVHTLLSVVVVVVVVVWVVLLLFGLYCCCFCFHVIVVV